MRSALFDRIRRSRDLMAFGLVGAIAFIVQMVLFDGLGRHGVGPLTANVLAVVAATAVAFAGNRYWVFRWQRGALVPEAIRFAAVNATTFALSEAVLALTYPLGETHDRVATDTLAVIGIGAASAIRFLAYRGTVFRGAGTTAPPVAITRRAPETVLK